MAALDLNPGMLSVARSLPDPAGAVIEWNEGSVLALPFPDASFDVVLCQLGLQFFPDRPAALREMRRVLPPGGRLVLSVFGPIAHSPATHALANALDRHVGPDASVAKRIKHALADPEELRALVAGAGFGDVAIHTTSKLARFPSPADYVRTQLAATPLASLVAQQEATGRERRAESLIADVGAALAPFVGDEGLRVPWEVHTVIARA